MKLLKVSLLLSLLFLFTACCHQSGTGRHDISSCTDTSSMNWHALSIEELREKLCKVFLPEKELKNLQAYIFQTYNELLENKAKKIGISVNEKTQKKLKDSIGEKYNRKYFDNLKASFMRDLTKNDIVLALNFYHSPAGQKFLELSPGIVSKTMDALNTNLSTWLPKEIDEILRKSQAGE